MAYCPNCKKEVATKREDLNLALVIVLVIFTGGIGLILYLIIWNEEPRNRCKICGSICHAHIITEYSNSSNQHSNALPSQYQELQMIENKVEKVNFCPMCGASLDDRIKLKFCAYCGSSIK